MSRYQNSFELDLTDIDLIERSLRRELARQRCDVETTVVTHAAREINAVLAKIHNQKIFYAQVKAPGIPAA